MDSHLEKIFSREGDANETANIFTDVLRQLIDEKIHEVDSNIELCFQSELQKTLKKIWKESIKPHIWSIILQICSWIFAGCAFILLDTKGIPYMIGALFCFAGTIMNAEKRYGLEYLGAIICGIIWPISSILVGLGGYLLIKKTSKENRENQKENEQQARTVNDAYQNALTGNYTEISNKLFPAIHKLAREKQRLLQPEIEQMVLEEYLCTKVEVIRASYFGKVNVFDEHRKKTSAAIRTFETNREKYANMKKDEEAERCNNQIELLQKKLDHIALLEENTKNIIQQLHDETTVLVMKFEEYRALESQKDDTYNLGVVVNKVDALEGKWMGFVSDFARIQEASKKILAGSSNELAKQNYLLGLEIETLDQKIKESLAALNPSNV